MTDRPIDPNDITPEMVNDVQMATEYGRSIWWSSNHRDIIAAVLTAARRWNLGPAEDRVTMGDVERFIRQPEYKGSLSLMIDHMDDYDVTMYDDDSNPYQCWVDIPAFAAEVAAWKEGQR